MKQTLLITAMIALTCTLAGCGKDYANATVKSLLDETALQKENTWCGQQPHPDLIKGCASADAAKWIMRDPANLAMVDKPEPWPNKDTAFFQSVIDATNASQQLPNAEQNVTMAERGAKAVKSDYAKKIAQTAEQNLVKLKNTIATVPANSLNAYKEESSWCSIQQAYQLGEAPYWGNQRDLNKISSSCAAISKAVMPGGF